MMLWCELHNTSGIKGGGITNFDPTEYEKDLAWLQTVTQVRKALTWLQKMPWSCCQAFWSQCLQFADKPCLPCLQQLPGWTSALKEARENTQATSLPARYIAFVTSVSSSHSVRMLRRSWCKQAGAKAGGRPRTAKHSA